MAGYSAIWGIPYPSTTDGIGASVFEQMASGADYATQQVDRISMCCIKPNTDSYTIPSTASRIPCTGLEGSAPMVKNGNGVRNYSGSILIPPNTYALVFCALEANSMNNGQNVVLELHVGTSYSNLTTSPVATYAITPAGGSGWVHIECAPYFVNWSSSTQYAFIAARSTNGGGYVQQNGTAIAAIGLHR